MKKFKKYAPWLIAGGAIAVAVGVHQFYANRVFLELPVFKLNGELKFLFPAVDKPFIYKLPSGQQLALYAVEAAEAVESAVTAA